jgi:nucleoside-diphosphate-sugar epimerase
MRVAILGATSQIAGDYIRRVCLDHTFELTLFSRTPVGLARRLDIGENSQILSLDYAAFSTAARFDVIINFVGAGNPAVAAKMGSCILDISNDYDSLALDYLKKNPQCRYIFLSSGAAYGRNFLSPANEASVSSLPLNALGPTDWYSVAKVYAETRHRAMHEFQITDVRIFNYFSSTIDLNARFLICDMVRAIRDKSILETSAQNITRDFIGPEEFFSAITAILDAPPRNDVIDLYSKAPVEKFALLEALHKQFGLNYCLTESFGGLNATGAKMHYYSTNRRAEKFGYSAMQTSLQVIEKELNKIPWGACAT